jgi:hypothetical protein
MKKEIVLMIRKILETKIDNLSADDIKTMLFIIDTFKLRYKITNLEITGGWK